MEWQEKSLEVTRTETKKSLSKLMTELEITGTIEGQQALVLVRMKKKAHASGSRI